MARYLARTSPRQFNVVDAATTKGVVWCALSDLAADGSSDHWRASTPDGVTEWRPWAFYRTPQAAAVACVEAFDRRAAERAAWEARTGKVFA